MSYRLDFFFFTRTLVAVEDYLSQLNEAQQEPTTHVDGPLMVIAGAGSGKTRVLTYRIAYLMQQGIDAFCILALTFTNKAAREMKTRIAEIVGESESKNLWMGTFHSIFARILRAEADRLGYPSSFTIYDTQDSERLVKSIIKEMNLDTDIYKPKQIRNRISSFKNSLITVRAYHDNPELVEADREARRSAMGNIIKTMLNVASKQEQWILMIYCLKPMSFSIAFLMFWQNIRIAFGIFWSMSTKTPTTPNI